MMISHENFNLICLIWIALGILIFPLLLKVKQPYGKHSKTGWGPMIGNGQGWLIMELPALLVFAFFIGFSPDLHNKIVLVAISLWGLHYIHRSLIFPFRIKTKGKKMPLIIVVTAIIFNTVNGFLNGYWLSHFVSDSGEKLFAGIHLYAGVILFLTGFIINQYHDQLLINLRKNGNGDYKIPYGGLFKFVSCPNYLGEIISWLGFFIVTLGMPAFAFLIWTMVNLIPRSLDHHKWYKNQFPDYPAKRRAIFPKIL